jgi:tRNA pseudouridine55 synthase
MKRQDDPSIVGVLLIDKPEGLTSHDVVARVRRALGVRRVGHAGTLDPMATGVLVVGVGPTTRLLGIVGGHGKEYEATIRLGAATTTDDREGEALSSCDPATLAAIDDSLITETLGRFVGTIAQRPSAVSAVKVDGKRAYDRVRAGEQVELAERAVTIAALDVQQIHRTAQHIDVQVRVECSAGTYIRALARDVGDTLGVGGHLTRLRRTRSGGVRAVDCIGIDQISRERLVPPAAFARMELPAVQIDAGAVALARRGGRFDVEVPSQSAVVLIGPDEDLVAVVDGRQSPWSYRAVFPALPGEGSIRQPAGEGQREHTDDEDDA